MHRSPASGRFRGPCVQVFLGGEGRGAPALPCAPPTLGPGLGPTDPRAVRTLRPPAELAQPQFQARLAGRSLGEAPVVDEPAVRCRLRLLSLPS